MTTMDTNELQAFGDRYAAAWCSQAPERVASFFADNGALSVNDNPPAVGREAIAGVARGFMTTFPDLAVAMDEVVPQAPGAIFHWTLTGTNTGPGGKGHYVRISGYEVWTFAANGLVESSKGQFDAAEYARQIEHGAGS